MVASHPHSLRTTFIGEAYPPCYKPLADLKPIPIGDLRLETHHRGRVLLVKTFCHPFRLSSVQNAVEDVNGEVERLSIYNYPSAMPWERVLPKGAYVAIKEPYYKVTADGGVTIRVDHPSDFTILKPWDESLPGPWRSEKKSTTDADDLKRDGNAAFKRGDWWLAAELYSEALNVVDIGEDLRRAIHCHRAQARLHLGQYELARDDASAAIMHGDDLPKATKMQNQKALFRLGEAQYKLGNFIEARKLFERALHLDLEDKTVAAYLSRTMIRISERDTGQYDFAAMSAAATQTHHHLDHASFLSKTKVGPAGHRGRGLFATENIAHGEIVMVEKAFQAAFKDKEAGESSLLIDINTNYSAFGAHAQLWRGLIDYLQGNPEQAAKYLDLHDGGDHKTKKPVLVNGSLVIDTFEVHAISQYNGFGCPSVKSSIFSEEIPSSDISDSTGEWLQASYINHACIGNASRAFIGDMMILRATKNIQAGDEILHPYCPTNEPFLIRKQKLAFYKFACDCKLCQVESQVPLLVLQQREQLAEAAKQFIAANQRSPADLSRPVPAAVRDEARGLLARLNNTYNAAHYGDLPRLACVPLDLWFCEAEDSSGRGIVTTTRLLRDLGFGLRVKSSRLAVNRANGVPMDQAVHGAMYGAQAWAAAGERDIARSLLAFAKEVYRTTNGEMGGFRERFGPDFDEIA